MRLTDQDAQCASQDSAYLPPCMFKDRAAVQRNYPIDRGNVELPSPTQHCCSDAPYLGWGISPLWCRLHCRKSRPVQRHGHRGLRGLLADARQVIRCEKTRAGLLCCCSCYQLQDRACSGLYSIQQSDVGGSRQPVRWLHACRYRRPAGT